jgi:putative transcriptional regulator
MRDLLRRFGLDPRQAAEGQVRVHYGGPVQRQRAFVLHTPDYSAEGTVRAGALALTTDPGILSAMAAGTGPRRALFAVGHAGWAPGQLEREIEEGYWFTAPADDALVFDADHATKWERATARRRITL